MAVPKHKISKSRRGNRRSHDALEPKNISVCSQCTEPKLPHRACPACGFYRGRTILEKKEKS